MSKRFRGITSALCLALLALCMVGPVTAYAADEATGATGTELPVTPTDTSATEAPQSMTQEQLDALQGITTADSSSDDKSTFDKVSDFITDNAPFIIIGIVVIAAILAGIFIMRGRNRTPGAPKASKAAAGAPAAVPSASELRRRKRAAMQQSREEERLRRKAGLEGRQAMAPRGTLPLSANLPVDPVEAEKQSARDQLSAAAAVARSGAIPAPVSPTQTAPAAGVVQPGFADPNTVFASPTPTPAELSAATAAAGGSPLAAPPAPEPAAAPELEPQPAPVQAESPTEVTPMSEPEVEPAIEAPGLDARVGEAAAAFAAGAAGGGIAGKALASNEPEAEEPVADPADDAARDAEQRLKAKVAEIKAEQGRGLAAAPVPPAVPAEPEPEPEVEASPVAEDVAISDQLDEAEEIQREVEAAEVIPPTPTGLAAVEQRLQANSDQRDRTLRDAEARLERIEQRAADAERRAAFAERLAQLKIDESERERRMTEVISGIDRAEERAIEAEERARAAEQVAAAALEDTGVAPAPTRPEAAPVPTEQTPPIFSRPPVPAPAAPAPEAVAPAPAPEPEEPAAPATRSPLFGSGLSGSRSSTGSLNLNSATFEELRDADLSVTQATRILAYRERFGGYQSVEDLEKVPGFPAELIESLRGRITV